MVSLRHSFVLFMATLLVTLAGTGTSHAVSVNDGFDPNANGSVLSTAVQQDGKIVIGGTFTMVSGVTRNYIARLKVDGSLDTSFIPDANYYVNTLTVQSDGKIVVGGMFSTVGGVTRNHIARLNTDGSLDTSFDPNANDSVHSLSVQADGKIIIAGYFNSIGGDTRTGIARLNADGSLDTSFDAKMNDSVHVQSLQANGKIVIGGAFTTIAGVSRPYIARLNADGSLDTSFVPPNANNSVVAIAVQSDGKILIGGWFTTLGEITRNYIARLNADGSLDPSFDPNMGNLVRTVVVQSNGKILIAGYLGTVNGVTCGNISRLNIDGSLDATFNPSLNQDVYAIVVQADGKIVIGGIFTTIGGVTRNHIARLNADGSLETSFYQTPNNPLFSIAMQPDSKIVIGGSFTAVGGVIRNKIARLNSDGGLDTTFDPNANGTVYCTSVQADGKILIGGQFTTVSGAARSYIAQLNPDGSLDTSFNSNTDNIVISTATQANGKIVIGGYFNTISGVTRNYIARLNADGSLDSTFNPNVNNNVNAIIIQADGKIVIGGQFTMVGGVTRNYIARLNVDGSLDTSFNANANGLVVSPAIQADGKIVIGGFFTTVDGVSRNYIARLNADGSLDSSFNPNANNNIYSTILQVDGKIVISGYFTAVSGVTRNRIARMNNDGSLDTSFDPNANGDVVSIAVQSDGKIVIGGYFTTVGGVSRNYIARLSNDDAAIQALAASDDGTRIIWARSNAAPEVDRVTFERSTDMSTWTTIGSGTRITGGWQLTGLSLPAGQNIYLRARGIAKVGYSNCSTSLVDSVKLIYLPPIITLTAPPIHFSNQASGTIAFSANEAATFQCSIDGGAYTPCTSPFTYTNLATGGHTLSIVAIDQAGNVSTPVTSNWNINTALAASSTILLPMTGQKKCFDAAGTEILCAGSGQDGDILAGNVWTNPRFTDNGNGTINDNMTGLTWARDANIMSSHDPSFDNFGTAGDGAVLWTSALDYIKKLNQEAYLGFSDWRLPNSNELISLVDASQSNPALPPGQPFLNVQFGSLYWTSNTQPGSYPEVAKSVNIGGFGIHFGFSKVGYGNFVWPVRTTSAVSMVNLLKTGQTACYDSSGTQIPCAGTGQDGELQSGISWPNSRFADNSDGTVTDSATGLIWSKDANLMANRDPSFDSDNIAGDGMVTWQHALDYVAKLNLGRYLGFNDWRLPNANELASLVDFSSIPCLSTGHPFTNLQLINGGYWSSSTNITTPAEGWLTSFTGCGLRVIASKSSYYSVWPVRGGYVQQKLTVTKSGSGIITPDSGTLIWNGDSTATRYAPGAVVTLSVAPAAGYTFSGWSGDCTGNGSCTVSMDQTRSVAAAFVLSPITGVCGTSNGGFFATAPSTNLCTAGTPSAVTGSGQWSWSCNGFYGGSNASCLANQAGDGNLDGDAAVTVADALRALRIAVGIVKPTAADLEHGDVFPLVNGKPAPDGRIDVADVLLILRKAVGIVSWQ